MNKGYVYFLTTYRRTTNYIGVTNNIPLSSSSVTLGRMFCKKCTSEALALVGVLVYTEEYDNISDAIAREKQLKNWHKQWK
ncbi:MAG: endonuclease [Balneola sp.]|jgi:putative endonuclease|nr:endonuclease [Balneola sp.]MAO76938.1 endonuclease [Balneola sp.]MBF64505.1 endonuclease [Balneola sp.]MBF65757.1 endonuclease [Balneola sp.]